MNWEALLPVAVVGISLVTGILIFPLGEARARLRTTLNLAAALLKLVLVALLVWGTARGLQFEWRFAFMPGWELVLRADFLSLLFAALSAVLWLVTTIFAVGYLEGSPNRSRFFGFFSLCVAATMGIALAGNLLTFLVFYEMLTVVTYPLVVHRGTARSLAAGRTYLLYTLAGGSVLLAGAVWLHIITGPADFVHGGIVAPFLDSHRPQLLVIFALLLGGFGVKAALVPLHGWLPEAMVAPAPVSALLHAVAVVKAGAFGIIRLIYDIYGLGSADQLDVLTPLAVLASITIIYGSLRAIRQDDLKRRLAFSTVSQLSYITLGTAIVGPLATIGGIVHLMHQGLMKITLFFCAGVLAETLGIHRVSEMRGVGARMPLTMAAFTVCAFGMIGVPPVAGFISKWYLGLGGVAGGHTWVIAVMALSSLLNAIYFLPIIGAAWFGKAESAWPSHGRRLEAHWMLLTPPIVTALLALGAGLLAGLWFGPLGLARMAVQNIYGS